MRFGGSYVIVEEDAAEERKSSEWRVLMNALVVAHDLAKKAGKVDEFHTKLKVFIETLWK